MNSSGRAAEEVAAASLLLICQRAALRPLHTSSSEKRGGAVFAIRSSIGWIAISTRDGKPTRAKRPTFFIAKRRDQALGWMSTSGLHETPLRRRRPFLWP